METVTVYGFGSSFSGSEGPNDIDILLVHRSIEPVSCQFAIGCKREFQRHLSTVDVVMLSADEADKNEFITKASATRLGIIESDDSEAQLRNLSLRIAALGSR